MNKPTSQLRYFDGRNLKNLNPWDVDDNTGWNVLGEDNAKEGTPEAFNKLVPTLFRAVQLRSQSAAGIPFALVKGETDFDTSQDWQNKVGFMPSPKKLIQLAEASLVLAGKAYEWRTFTGTRTINTVDLRHLIPSSVTEVIAQDGTITWKRNTGQGPRDVEDPRSIVYIWYPDPYVEIGPAKAFPAQAALSACGVLANMDSFTAAFFARGAIKATLFAAQDMPKGEADKFETWWNRFIGGVKNAFTTKIINASKIDPVVVGEGLESMQNTELDQEQKQDIAVALGIPFSILFSDAANYATANQDWLNFYNTTVIPECEIIAEAWNEQIFEPLGLRFEFRPETLDCFQEDEQARAQALTSYVNVGFPLLMACDILGVELTDQQRLELEAAAQQKQERADQLTQQLAGGNSEDEPDEEEPEPDEEMQNEMRRWMRKALRKGANVEFIPDRIDQDTAEAIRMGLAQATNDAEIKAVFDAVLKGRESMTKDAAAVLEGIRLGVEALSKKGE